VDVPSRRKHSRSVPDTQIGACAASASDRRFRGHLEQHSTVGDAAHVQLRCRSVKRRHRRARGLRLTRIRKRALARVVLIGWGVAGASGDRLAAVDVYEFAAANQGLLDGGNWDAYELSSRSAAESLAGQRLIDKIAHIDLGPYTIGLEDLLHTAMSEAGELAPTAMYFEYDLDNDWESGVFYCRSFEPPVIPFVEWPADFKTYTEGPTLPEFARLFARYGWSKDGRSRGVVLLTVARTTAAFGRALTRTRPGSCPWGIGFHDQSPITVLTNPTRRRVDRTALDFGLATLGGAAADEARRLLPDSDLEASACTTRHLRWSWRFRTCRRREWRSIGGSQMMAELPDEVSLEATGWQSGTRRVVVLGPNVEAPVHCVVFEEDPDEFFVDAGSMDDLEVLAAPAEENYLAALRRRGIDPHR